jgi:hypothetical protein
MSARLPLRDHLNHDRDGFNVFQVFPAFAETDAHDGCGLWGHLESSFPRGGEADREGLDRLAVLLDYVRQASWADPQQVESAERLHQAGVLAAGAEPGAGWSWPAWDALPWSGPAAAGSAPTPAAAAAGLGPAGREWAWCGHRLLHAGAGGTAVVPAAVLRNEQQDAVLVELTLTLVGGVGPGLCAVHPGFAYALPRVENACRGAVAAALSLALGHAGEQRDGVWRLWHERRDVRETLRAGVEGSSLGAQAARAWACLLQGHTPDPRVLALGTVQGGELQALGDPAGSSGRRAPPASGRCRAPDPGRPSIPW